MSPTKLQKDLKSVLILAYFFPPCTLTAAQRAYSWARDFHKYGLYPIVITRNWDLKIQDQVDLGRSSGTEPRVEKHDNYEVHYVPYHASWRDKQYARRAGRSNLAIKTATFVELFGQYYSTRILPYHNILTYTEEYLASKGREVQWLLTSVQPWPFLKFSSIIKSNFPHIKWVADYRDDWNTANLGKQQSPIHRFLTFVAKNREPKWVSSAEFFTSVSEGLVERIGHFINKNGYVVSNGFDQLNFDLLDRDSSETSGQFVVTYSGFLYAEQKVEVFLEAFKEFCDSYGDDGQILLQFIGLDYYPPSADRVRKAMRGYESFLEITPRIPIDECVKKEIESDVLLMIAYGNEKGIPASKLYQYIGCKRPILVCPSDHDIIEKIVTTEGVGVSFDCKDQVLEFLIDQFVRKCNKEDSGFEFSGRKKYSREYQTAIMADHIKEYQ